MGTEICFDAYLRSVVSAYQQWWRLYTLTDATGRESQRVESDRIAPAFFDFGLMVQTVDKEKVESQKASAVSVSRTEKGEEEKKEKIERLPVLEGICKYAAEHVLLVGRPGSGKSTALARLLLQEAEKALEDKQAKIPVLVELRYLPSDANESSVGDRILTFMHKHDPALDIDEAGVKHLLRQGRLLLLVDGVNELPSARGRVMVNQFRELYQKNCPMIFTTRELSAGGDLGIAKRLEMQPLTEPQMQQFVMAYLPTQGERLLGQLSGREFWQTPLLLWMLCLLFQHPVFSGQIPPNLGKVFRAFEVGYSYRIKQDVTISKDSRAWWGWERLLQYLAFKMTCGESLTELQAAISRREAEQIFVEFLLGKVEFLRGKVEVAKDCAVRWLEDLLKHHLIQISNDRIEFRHQLIQEYYAAEWLLGLLPSLSDARLQHDYLNYLKWTEPLALMLELVESEEQAVRVVRLALEINLRLGARLAGAVMYKFREKTVGLLIQEIDERKMPQMSAIELLKETKPSFIIRFLRVTLKDKNLLVRWSAAEALGEIGSEMAINALSSDLGDQNQNSSVRESVAAALVKIGSEKAIDALIGALRNQNSSVHRSAAEALVKIGSKKAIDALSGALRNQNSSVRRSAVEALVKIGSEKAIDALSYALINQGYDVREITVEALVKIGSEKDINALIGALKVQDSYVRRSAAKELGKIGSEKAIDALSGALKDKDSYVRRNAAAALGEIGSEKAIDALSGALKDKDSYVRESVAAALVKIGSVKAIDALSGALKDKDSYVREIAAAALVKIGSEKAIDALSGALKDKDSYVRRNAAEALVKIGSEKAIYALIGALKDQDSYVRRNAAEALGKTKKVIYALIGALKDQDSYVRRNAAEALGKTSSEKAIYALIGALKDQDSYVRRNAAEALVKIGSEKAIDALIGALKDQDSYVRENAAEALVKIGSKKAIDALIGALKDQDSYVSRNAAVALGKTKKAIYALIGALKDQDSNVRRNAAVALGEIGSVKAIDALIGALKDQDSYVRENAEEALGKIGSVEAIDALIGALKDQDSYVRENAAEALVEIAKADCNLPILTLYLPHLASLIATEASLQALSVITAIQSRPTTGNTYIFQAPVGQVINEQTVQGDNIGTQNN